MNTATQTKPEGRALVIAQQLDASVQKIGEAIPKGLQLPSERVIRIAKTAIMNDAKLRECTAQSIVTACMKAAADGLVCDGREAALVPFNRKVKTAEGEEWISEAQYIIMYRGMIKLSYRTSLVSTIDVCAVYSNEDFEVFGGDDARIEHKPIIIGDKGEIAAFYSIVRMRDGGITREVMSRAEVERIRDRMKNKNPVWVSDFIEMGKKTVLRRHAKRLPFESDIAAAFEDHALVGDPDFEPDAEAQPGEPEIQKPRKKKGAAAAKLNGEPKTIEGEAKTVEKIDKDTGEITDEPAEEAYQGDVV